jgi:sterol desaturase/sphingolipid hydroxylase (fatty acid hydroxylase superfamily)
MLKIIYQKIQQEIYDPSLERRFGTGWISGMLGLFTALISLCLVICILFPQFFTVPQLRELYLKLPYRLILFSLIGISFFFSILSLFLRRSKTLGLVSISIILLTTMLGNFQSFLFPIPGTFIYFGLDWFILNLILTGALFIPLEKIFPNHSEQGLFRAEWREDLFYYFISSMLVQILTYLALFPATQIVAQTNWQHFRQFVGQQPFVLQFIEIMFFTDLVQYWVHRLFHKIPWLWNFHAVHHSAKSLDWMAGARMHFLEIIILRGLTVIPMQILGFSLATVQFYILVVYLYSTLIHANVSWSPSWLNKILVVPRFHHWHHGIEREAIDVNFAIHFPFFDILFKTYYMPENKWPKGYGIKGDPVPLGYIQQFIYPLRLLLIRVFPKKK